MSRGTELREAKTDRRKAPRKGFDRRGKRRWGDVALVLAFVGIDVALFLAAGGYFHSLNELATEHLNQRAPVSEDQVAIQQLRKIAESGSWKEFEEARQEEAMYFLRGRLQPSPGIALYFFPETLPKRSFERTFYEHDLKKPLQVMKKAYEANAKDETIRAFHLIEIRVQNYELGASQDPSRMSPEAGTFLNIYRQFTGLEPQGVRAPANSR